MPCLFRSFELSFFTTLQMSSAIVADLLSASLRACALSNQGQLPCWTSPWQTDYAFAPSVDAVFRVHPPDCLENLAESADLESVVCTLPSHLATDEFQLSAHQSEWSSWRLASLHSECRGSVHLPVFS